MYAHHRDLSVRTHSLPTRRPSDLRHDDVVAAVAVLALPLAVRAALGGAVRVVLEGDQRGDVVVDDEPHVAPGAAVTAVGPAHRRVRLAPNSSKRSEEHTSELQSLMRISYAVFCLNKKKTDN